MIEKSIYGHLDGRQIYKYTISNKNGMKFSCISHGATLTEIYALDKNKKPVNVLLEFDKSDYYVKDTKMFAGAAIGRVAGRIDKGEFEIKGRKYKIEPNEGENVLHGGKYGFNSYIWESESSEKDNSVTFYRMIKEGKGGFLGELKAKITYSLNDNNDLNIHFSGLSDEDTLFNPTVHSYFNLSGNIDNLLKNHTLKINADYVAETRSDNVPTGELKKVKETPFDFLEHRDLMTAIEDVKKKCNLEGIDHPFKLKSKNAATLISNDTGIKLCIESERNALIVYTLNFPCEDFEVNGKKIPQYGAVALEPQTLPDAIHHKNFGNIVLPKGEEKSYNIKYHFGLISKE
ncbi:aldose 1-epimerase [Clostridium acetobutylicum]|uniref:Aldose 1-epimerase n=1 Tax=Clostridium acetobutylicum (strain ATCC 824 / DSM 792 / JCM 1419 / IAM 19013 / LMG 5710 / NBRC 13948 / NRRL B-527 / VKM B-1787 / 2291 / W) TaxID=272562 RepID=Q97JD7_CLOAB|nr:MULTISPECIES: aldose epimerase family protein [Clostridium]AAK79317.1 Aldose-1-epimerase [Clostridium acetobutylicum ATCC 824]ADZ20400.1 Aldose-1-epimerase [Clostridium acetobutylicum EA 2018]AEI33569.1 aldose-1-epimerase [Clostridium acetobutylicum DSM 1731]AWV81432.1 galactose mutarotase [Clostridium acetobutylicum]MBC2393069.1 galactose mutarotase [Clostridium acetobutylicum]